MKLHRGEVPFLYYPAFEKTGLVRHGFSVRPGGVSQGIFSSMNLSFTRGDREEDVRENYRRIGKALSILPEQMVCSDQTHTTHVVHVGKEDCGKGVTRPREWKDVDGMITDCPGVALTTFYADCVPLYFLDPVHRAIGLSHSGWKGTAGKMGKVTVEKMGEAFGSRPEDLVAAIGPSICQDFAAWDLYLLQSGFPVLPPRQRGKERESGCIFDAPLKIQKKYPPGWLVGGRKDMLYFVM